MYSLLIETYIEDSVGKDSLFRATSEFPCIQRKANWAKHYINDYGCSFSTRLIAFAIIEGIFFSSSFAAIFFAEEEKEYKTEKEIVKHTNLSKLSDGAMFRVKWLTYDEMSWEPRDGLIDTEALQTYINGLKTRVPGARKAKLELSLPEKTPNVGVHIFNPNHHKSRFRKRTNWTLGSKKNFTGKKMKVIEDELGLKGKGGCYCFMPHDCTDDNDKAIFKIGMTLDFSSRFDQYHTSFPESVYFVAFLIDPKVPMWDDDKIRAWKIANNKSSKKDVMKAIMSQRYKEIEKYLFDYVENKDGRRLYSSVNVKNPDPISRKGATEWFYADVELIHEAYTNARLIYGGEKILFNFNGLDPDTGELVTINELARRKKSVFPNYSGNVTYSV